MNEDDGRCLLSLYEHSCKPVAGSHLLFPFSTTKAPGERLLKLRSVFICVLPTWMMPSFLYSVYRYISSALLFVLGLKFNREAFFF